ncbi:ABC transporter ATP-binding protein [Aminivibrio sp.]|uniref:ABC transporter ATP-binding protein n=1 Tax=Aminivibrio sp. TaxID=1872489 RepID=UPI003D96D44B
MTEAAPSGIESKPAAAKSRSSGEKSSLRKLYEIFTPQERMQALLIFFAGLLTALAQTAGVFSIFPFINVVMDPASIQQNKWLADVYDRFSFANPSDFMIALGSAVVVLVILSNTVTAMTMWAKTRFVLNRNYTLSNRLLAVYLARPYAFFLTNNTSDLGKNVLSEVNQLTTTFLLPLFEAMINLLVLVVIVIMLFSVNPAVTLGTLAFLGTVYGTLNIYLKVRLKQMGTERMEANKKRFRAASEALASIKISRILGAEPYFLDRYAENSLKFARLNVFARVAGQLPSYLMESIVFGGLILFIVFALVRGGEVASVIPLVSLYAFAGKRLIPALQVIYSSVTQIYYNKAVLDRLYQDLVSDEQSNLLPREGGEEDELHFRRRILLDKIYFRYPDGEQNIIDGLDLEIPRESTVGLVGSTGSGKTTLVDIILGLHIPREGRMLIDDTPVTVANIRAWRRKIGYVPQDIYLSDDTVTRNIAFGIPDNEIDSEHVRHAARIAALDDFIQALPEKYGTVIGERGVRLSGGQRQRIGLARALYRNPEVLMLDEATSALDGTTEEAVLSAIRSASKAKTVIMIAHRLNTLKDCDTIYMMENGRISASGTYDGLLRENKEFMRMAKVETEQNNSGAAEGKTVEQ